MDFDPTNDLLPDLEHITLAWGRDFSDVSPLRGVILGGGGGELIGAAGDDEPVQALGGGAQRAPTGTGKASPPGAIWPPSRLACVTRAWCGSPVAP